MQTANPPIIGPNWGSYSYQFGDGLLARIHFDAQATAELQHAGYTDCVRVILFMPGERVHQNGQPGSSGELKALLARQRQFVDHLVAESVNCRFVGSMLYGGMFDLVFQIDSEDFGRFKASASEWAKTASPYRVEIKQLQGWDFFDSKVRPSPEHRQQIEDRRIIQELIKAGSDPKKRHQLDHELVGPNRILSQVARDLQGNGFLHPRFPTEGVLVIRTESSLDLFEVWGTTRQLVRYCASCGVRYGGWGAAIVPATG
jgi:hypothetical protein